MSCSKGNCLGVCRCNRRICWQLGVNTSIKVDCPTECNSGCNADTALLADSWIVIKHPCLEDELVRVDDVLEIGRCDCVLTLPASFPEITNFKRGCDNCVFQYQIWATIKESDDDLADTCTVLVEAGEIYFDWSLV